MLELSRLLVLHKMAALNGNQSHQLKLVGLIRMCHLGATMRKPVAKPSAHLPALTQIPNMRAIITNII